jgi:hypothetical protein
VQVVAFVEVRTSMNAVSSVPVAGLAVSRQVGAPAAGVMVG